jgi:uncharacterized damage-inducible protein DinB
MQLSSSLSTRLQYQHKCLIDIIEGLSDEQVRRAIIPGKWSIFENIVHLQTYQHVFITRIREMLEKDNPVFERYTAEADLQFLDNCEKSIREVMHDMITVRKQMSAEILTFPDTDLLKTGTHPAYGTMTLPQWLNFFLLHEAHHLFVIFKLVAEFQKGRPA